MKLGFFNENEDRSNKLGFSSEIELWIGERKGEYLRK